MEISAGNYYRRHVDGAIVKVLHPEVHPYHCYCGSPGVECHDDDNAVIMYRMREGTRSEFCLRQEFSSLFEGPLDWDTALKEFK